MREPTEAGISWCAQFSALLALREKFPNQEQFQRKWNETMERVPRSALLDTLAYAIWLSARQLTREKINEESRDFKTEFPEKSLAEQLKGRARRRWWFRSLTESRASFHVAYHYGAVGYGFEKGSHYLHTLYFFLEIAKAFADGRFGDPESVVMLGKYAKLNREQMSMDPNFSSWPEAVAAFFPEKFLGKRGGAKRNPAGAARGLLVRKLDSYLPKFDEDRAATIAELLTVASIDGVSRQFVGEILRRKSA